MVLALSANAPGAFAQFSSGSTGQDGAYKPTVSGNFDPTKFSGSGVPNNVFNFTTITIPAGVTITLTAGLDNAPVYWLAKGDVDIEGTLDLSGSPGTPGTMDVDLRLPAFAGSGGYGGGVGGNWSTGQRPTPGSGPGGGASSICPSDGVGGTFTGNQYLIPLVGGSGGGGYLGHDGTNVFGGGGGAGGGALLLASSTNIIINGTITANGGQAVAQGDGCYPGGSGSGGAIRLVSNTISGKGTVTALGGVDEYHPIGSGSPGRVRLEAYTIASTIQLNATPVGESTPTIPLYPPTAVQPSVLVTSINGTPITENPFKFPDIKIDTANPVPVLITSHQVPVGTTATLIILGESADQDSGLQCTLAGTLATSTCTISVKYAFGGSRGLVKATWQNPGSQ
jgi:hypothetical protein